MLRTLLSVTAVGMVLSSTLVHFDAAGPGESITPPGPFFAIWGLIIALCLALAAVSWLRPNPAVVEAIGWPLTVAQLGFTVWLFVAADHSAAGTVVVFAAILAALIVGLSRLRNVTGGPGRGLASVALGAYAGWSSAAIWLNIVTTLPARLADTVAVQAAGLIAAGVTAAAVILFLRPSVAYAGAVGWGLIGIVLAAGSHRAWVQMGVAVVDLVAVAALAVAVGRSVQPPG